MLNASFAGGAVNINTNYTTPTDDGWQFLIAPYGWMASISGDITVKGITNHIFIPFSEILDHLDFVGEVHFEASHGRWAFMFDPTYLKVSKGFTTNSIEVGPLNRFVIGPITGKIVSQTLLIDGGIFYQILSANNAASTQFISLEMLGGARYFYLRNKITLNPRLSELFPGITVSGSTSVAAPIIGLRIKDNFAKLHLWLRADVGGFGVDHINNTWSIIPGMSYSISPNVELGLAYRVLKIKVTKAVSSSLDILMYGPELGVVFRF